MFSFTSLYFMTRFTNFSFFSVVLVTLSQTIGATSKKSKHKGKSTGATKFAFATGIYYLLILIPL
jgi:hypothetical protein